MNRNHYDERHAAALVPLLRSITGEIQERSETIARLENELEHLRRPTKANARALSRIRGVEASLCVQRRDLRYAVRELERLGCALDEDHPLRVLIPGRDGELDHGFAWSPLDETHQATSR